MTIESRTFRGTQPPVSRSEPDKTRAIEALNAWRGSNLDARIISIETLIVVDPAYTDRSKFDGVRVWFETLATPDHE